METPKKKSYRCPTCQKTFKERKALWRHAQTHTEWRQKKYTCELCKKGFTERSSYKEHLISKNHNETLAREKRRASGPAEEVLVNYNYCHLKI